MLNEDGALQVEGAANQQSRPSAGMQAPRAPSFPPSQANRDSYTSNMQYRDSAPQNPNEQYRPDPAAYSRPPGIPDYRQPAQQQEAPQQGRQLQNAGPQYSYQAPAQGNSQQGYTQPSEYGRGNADSPRGYPDSSRAYADPSRSAAAAGNRDYGSFSAQPLSPQSPSAADAKKAAYRYCPAACTQCALLARNSCACSVRSYWT